MSSTPKSKQSEVPTVKPQRTKPAKTKVPKTLAPAATPTRSTPKAEKPLMPKVAAKADAKARAGSANPKA